MKLLRIGPPGAERPVTLLPDGRALDLSGVLSGDGPYTPRVLADVAAAVAERDLPEVATERQRFGSPLPLPGKIVCIGLNYRDHAAETGASIPEEPIVFLKAPDTVVGPHDSVLVPRGSTKTDYEVELGVVIGTQARYLGSAEEGLAAVAGYVVSHDVSEREYQLERGGQWDKGKNCETFNPLGPWFVTADEVGDPGNLGLRCWVNGELRQDGSTKDLIFGVGELVRYLSQFMVLHPGDVINTGTPAGVALGQPDPKPYLQAGDVVELEIDGLGRQRQVLEQA
jgi:2-keto-4-pentenoate hydratase/2-oxohepta-3-ene-1,7-dioic acid hydratase in catechol pathway